MYMKERTSVTRNIYAFGDIEESDHRYLSEKLEVNNQVFESSHCVLHLRSVLLVCIV